MIEVACVSPLNGWKQVGAPHWTRLEQHVFGATPDGQLAHYTDSALRCVVPPEGWEDYCRMWPDAQAVVDQLRKRPAAAAPAEEPAPAAPGDTA